MPDIRLILAAAAVALLVAVLVLVPQLAQPRVQEIRVNLEEWSLGFQRLHVRTGKLAFVVSNTGTVEHGFEIEGELEGEEVEWEIEPFAPGLTKTLEVELPPGEYEVYCPVPGHKEKGMVAKLIVP